MTEKQLMEENRKYMLNVYEMKERACMNKRYSEMCRECKHYGTERCLHPEKAFPHAHRY